MRNSGQYKQATEWISGQLPRSRELGVREITKRSRDSVIWEGAGLSDQPTPVQL